MNDHLQTVPGSPSMLSVVGHNVVVPVLWMFVGAGICYALTRKSGSRKDKE